MGDEKQRELWDIGEVARHLGATSTGSARRTLSRWRVQAVEYRAHPESGRPRALYDAAQIRAAQQSRPGRGHRSDLAR
jgi:hypothetical protein